MSKNISNREQIESTIKKLEEVVDDTDVNIIKDAFDLGFSLNKPASAITKEDKNCEC